MRLLPWARLAREGASERAPSARHASTHKYRTDMDSLPEDICALASCVTVWLGAKITVNTCLCNVHALVEMPHAKLVSVCMHINVHEGVRVQGVRVRSNGVHDVGASAYEICQAQQPLNAYQMKHMRRTHTHS